MAWLVSANQTAQIVGPALGGFLSARSPEAAYVAAAALFVAAGMCAASSGADGDRARSSP